MNHAQVRHHRKGMLRYDWPKVADYYFKYRQGLGDLRSSAIAGVALSYICYFILVKVENLSLSWP